MSEFIWNHRSILSVSAALDVGSEQGDRKVYCGNMNMISQNKDTWARSKNTKRCGGGILGSRDWITEI